MKAKTLQRKAGQQAKQVGTEAGRRAREAALRAERATRGLRREAGVRSREARRRVGFWIAGEEPRKRHTGRVLIAGAAGAAAAYFLDPQSGKRRRSLARDWLAARFRRAGRTVSRAGRGMGARGFGAWQSFRHREEGQPENDATLAHKVESEVFRGLDVPSGHLNVNAEHGVVVLRGMVERPDQIVEIERRVRDVQGVRGVENLLHVNGSPTPTRQ
jgi:hyperosmotically inducible periplasmic protein